MDGGAALVLFSGGQDSTTCLGWALERFKAVETIGFDYGQRHRVELEVRPHILALIRKDFPTWGNRLGEDHLLDLGVLGQVSETSLTREVEIAVEASGLPNSFVPGRNLLFLTLAAALAYRRGARNLVIGVCETDYSGYPDCRAETMDAMQTALNLGLESEFRIHTPLMHVDKAGTWAMADAIGGAPFVDLIRDETHSCYRGDRAHFYPWGRGCADCPACELRAKGWERWRTPLADGERPAET